MKAAVRNTTKWLLSLVFALVVISLILIPQVLKVESEAAAATPEKTWYTSHTGDSTYTLTTKEQLLGFFDLLASNTTNFNGKTIKLGNDIDLNPGKDLNLTYNSGFTIPSIPDNTIYVGDKVKNSGSDGRWFYGTFDGQGFKIRGAFGYATAGSNGYSNNNVAGLFGNLSNGTYNGTIKNLVIENSIIYYQGNGNADPQVGGLCSCLRGTASIQNCYLDLDIVVKNDANKAHYIGAIACYGSNSGSNTPSISNVVYAGTIGVTNGQSSTAFRDGSGATTNGRIGFMYQNGSGANLKVTNVLNRGIVWSNNANNNNGNGISNYGNGGSTGWTVSNFQGSFAVKTNTAYAQTSSISGWLDFNTQGHYGSYLPPLTPIRITGNADLLQVVKLVNDGATTFEGSYIMLEKDLDINPGWDASVTLSGSTGTGLANSTGTITLPPSPGTSWPNTATPNVGTNAGSGQTNQFRGTFDGLGHVISGIYAYKDANQSRHFGLLFNELRSGGVIRNLIITNSTIVWNQNSGYGGSGFGGVVGCCNGSGSTISNVYVEMDIVLQSNAHSKLAWGGIAGWNSANMTNCVFKGRMIETSAQNSTTYPATVTTRHIGGVTGECEGGAITDCVGMVTFAVKESSVGFQKTDQNTTSGGAHQAIAGHYNSDYGTTTRVYGGAQTSAPVSGWLNYTKACGTYVPATFMGSYLRATLNDATIASFTAGTSYFPGSTVLISSTDDFTSLISKVNNDSYRGAGVIFKLTTNIDFAPGTQRYAQSTWSSGASISYPSGSNFTRFTDFKGTLDGQGYTLSGLYARRIAYNNSYEGGLFYLLHGTVRNLAITNCFFCGDHTHNGSTNYTNASGVIWGGLAGKAGFARIENCFFDYDCFLINNYASSGYGYLFGQEEGACGLTNVVVNGQFRVAKTDGTNTIATTGGSACGVIAGNGNSYKTYIKNFLFCGTRNTYIAGSGGTNSVAFLVHWSNGGCVFSGTNVYGSKQTSSVSGWTNQMSTYGTYTPCNVVPSKYVVKSSGLALSNFNAGNYYKVGTSFNITSYSEYNTFASKINSDGTSGAGYIFQITTDMNINPSWRAKGEAEWDGSAGAVDFSAGAPGNPWPVMTNFRGTLDGQGHLIEGIYVYRSVSGESNNAGVIAHNLGDGATIKNLAIRNARSLSAFTGGYNRVGGIAGYATGNNVTLKNIYLDIDIVVGSWSGNVVGGFIGGINGNNITLDNLMFAGNIYMAKPTSSTTSFALPTTSTGAIVTELIANVNYKTTLVCTNIVLAGMRYANGTVLGNYNKWQGTANSSDEAWGTKMRYNYIILDMVDLDDSNFSSAASTSGWRDAYLVGGNAQGSAYSGGTITDLFKYSTRLGQQAPATVKTMVDALTFHNFDPVTVSITTFTGSEIAGSIFTIANATELQYAVDLSQDNDVTFSGYTLRLTGDIDLNPGWNGHVTVSDGTATLPTLPVNIFRGFKNFSGTLDGQNYYISGIFMMGTITNSSFHLAPIENTGSNTVIKRLKLINGLILAYDNYSENGNYTDNKISGLVARNSGSLTIDSVYNAMEVWYNGFYGQKIAGFVSINHTGSSSSTLKMNNVKFAGVVGNMKSSGGVLSVPNGTSAAKVSQLVADGGSVGSADKLVITYYTMGGTVYISSASNTNNPPAAVTTGLGSGTVGTGDEGAGTATVVSKSYVNALASHLFPMTVYASWTGGTTTYEGGSGIYTFTYNYESIDFWDNFNALPGNKLPNAGFTGYTCVARYKIGDNYFYQFENPNEYSLYFTFISTGDANESAWRKGRGSVFVTPAGGAFNASGSWTSTGTNANDLAAPTPIEASNLCTAQIWQLDIDNAWSTASGGMGYIIRLTNGHFIIVDGGYASAYDARHIYKILKENNVLGGNPQVDAWFITHLHDDHFGALVKFAASYATQVDVSAFYFNFPSNTVSASEDDEGINTENVFTVVQAMKTWRSATLYSKIHAGQTFLFTGLNATVMSTHESVSMKYYNGSSMVANSFADGNDTSLVVKFTFFPGTAREQTLMITGDACVGEAKFLDTAYATADLQSDIIQVSHHGWYGLTASVYTKMDKGSVSSKKAVYLWPQDVIGYTKTNDTYNYRPSSWNSSESGGNFGYLYTVSESNTKFGQNYGIRTRAKEVIPAHKDHCLTLPYRATANYSTTYWTTGSYSNLQSAYNTKKNSSSNWDGSASGQTADAKFPITSWWNDGANSTYNINSIVDFYEFVRVAQSNNFSGKTVNLNVSLTLNDFKGDVTFANSAMTVASGLNNWSPIPSFAGTFNGNNNSISGLYANVTYNNTGAKGGFIKTLAGGTIRNLAILHSAAVFRNTADWGSTNMFEGGVIGNSTGGTIQDCTFDINTYVITTGATSFAGVLAKVDSGTVNITRVTYSGEIAYVTAGYEKGGPATVSSGQHMYGPNGILGHKNDGTVNLTDVKFLGTRVKPSVITGGTDFSSDLYNAGVTTGTVNVSGTNQGGTTSSPAALPTENNSGTASGYYYDPSTNTVLDYAHATQANPVRAQTSVANSKINTRVLATLTKDAAQRALILGYKVEIKRASDGLKANITTEQMTVYKSIEAAGATVSAEDLGGDYIYGLTLANFPTSTTYKVKVQTRFCDQSGVEHYGAPQYFNLASDGTLSAITAATYGD